MAAHPRRLRRPVTRAAQRGPPDPWPGWRALWPNDVLQRGSPDREAIAIQHCRPGRQIFIRNQVAVGGLQAGEDVEGAGVSHPRRHAGHVEGRTVDLYRQGDRSWTARGAPRSRRPRSVVRRRTRWRLPLPPSGTPPGSGRGLRSDVQDHAGDRQASSAPAAAASSTRFASTSANHSITASRESKRRPSHRIVTSSGVGGPAWRTRSISSSAVMTGFAAIGPEYPDVDLLTADRAKQALRPPFNSGRFGTELRSAAFGDTLHRAAPAK